MQIFIIKYMIFLRGGKKDVCIELKIVSNCRCTKGQSKGFLSKFKCCT